jgi:hypothetical protein
VSEKGAYAVDVRQSCSVRLALTHRHALNPLCCHKRLGACYPAVLLFTASDAAICTASALPSSPKSTVTTRTYFLAFVFATRAGVACCEVAIPVVSAKHKFGMTYRCKHEVDNPSSEWSAVLIRWTRVRSQIRRRCRFKDLPWPYIP